MSSTFINFRSVDDIYNLLVNYLQKGYVQVDLEKITFQDGVTDYYLDNSNLISVSAIEGVNQNGNSIPPTGAFNGVSALTEGSDYDLFGDAGTDGDGVQLYSGIRFTNSSQFEDESTVYITYVYYDEDQKSNITNFNDGSVAGLIARATAIQLANLYNINERLYNAGSVARATGSDLQNHGDMFNVSFNSGTKASGTVLVTVGSGDDDVTISTTNAFVSNVAGENLIFRVVTGGTVTAGNSQEFQVISEEYGYKYNVGSNSINRLYQTSSLLSEITTSTITVTNNPIKLDGTSNQFTGGSDKESNKQYRDRIYDVSTSLGRATKSAIKGGLEQLDNVKSVIIEDWHDNKDVAEGNFNILPISNTSTKLLNDSASLATINTQCNLYRPVGSAFTIKHPMTVMIGMSGSATIDDIYYDDFSTIISDIQTAITNYINDLEIGDDVLYAELIAKAMSVGKVYDFDIDSLEYTEFATNPNSLDTTTLKLSDNEGGGGTTYWSAYHEVKFLTNGRVDTWIYSGVELFDTEYTPVVSSPTPSVYLAVSGGDESFVRDPAYTIDFYSGISGGQIQIDALAGSGVNRTLVSGVDRLNFYYETSDTDTINGLRVKLHGELDPSASGTVQVEFWSGVDSPSGGTLLESGTITVLSGTHVYEIDFSTPLTVGDPTDTYYVLLSGTSALASGSYISLPISASGTQGAFSTSMYSGSTDEIVDDTWGIVANSTFMVHTKVTSSGVSDITIERNANTPDVAVVYSIDVGTILKSSVVQTR